MFNYQQILDTKTNSIAKNCVKRSDGWIIPFDPDNTDYQQYLKWVAEGNEPLPADQGDA